MRSFVLLLFLTLACPFSALADMASVQLENTKASLVTERSTIEPGKDTDLAIILEPKAGWHTYWENPGDAGMPTSLTWTLPEGFKASGIDWPAPEHLTEGPLLTYAYPHTVFLPVTVTPPATLDNAATYAFKVKVEWLVCKDICVPESAELELSLPVAGNASASKDAGLFGTHREQRPKALTMPGNFAVNGKNLEFALPLSFLKTKDVQSVQLSLRDQNTINYAAKQTLSLDHDTVKLTTEKSDDKPADSLSGILDVTSADKSVTHYNVVFKAGAATPAIANAPTEDAPLWFPVVILFALLGGLVLNLMPCVLPILSLKALTVAKSSGHENDHVVRHGIAYTLGILLTFTVIASILIGLRQAGQSVGWGYQMQSPAFVGFLIYLLFMVGLSLSGLFHLPVLLGGVGGNVVNESSTRGSFFTGILATAVATPCTAPFMASAVGAALTMPPLQALLVFEALGFGLALPFLLISLFPAARRFLPKPGAWMDTFKQLVAFPMYASVIWLMWVLTLQTGAGGMVIAATGMLLIIVIIWMKALFEDGSKAYTVTALVLYAALLLITLPDLSRTETSTMMAAEQGVTTLPYTKEKLDELVKAGKPVFVDATAAWCITCQVNARVALHTEATMKLFKEKGVTLMIADWTKRNDSITEFLSSFGYKGVPLCVFYPADGKKPVVMPQILTEATVIQVIKGE